MLGFRAGLSEPEDRDERASAMKAKRDDRPPRGPDPSLMRYAGLGTELAAGIAGFTLIGYWIDTKFDTGNIGLITGATVGSVGGLYHLIRRAVQMSAEQEMTKDRRRVRRNDENDEQHTD